MVTNILKIDKNPNKKEYEEITKDVIANDNYCPCIDIKSIDSKCMCKEFREQKTKGYCRCGRYVKIEMEEVII